MLSKRIILLAALISVLPLSSAFASGSRHHHHPSGCEQSARSMLKACRYDVRDDLFTTIASCQNIDDMGDRWACYADANTQRDETSEECGDVFEAREEACEILGEDRYDPDPLLDPDNAFIDPDDVPGVYAPNPYVSVAEGHTYVLRVGNEEDEEAEEELVVVHVTGESREIQGVLCRVVVDVGLEVSRDDGVEYEVKEATDDWFAQDTDGNVYYCGEISRNFEDGVLRDIDGSFESGIEYAKAGTLIRRYPVAEDAHRQEYAPGEAEDIVQYVDLATGPTEDEGGDNLTFPCGTSACVKTFDFAPIDPESTEYKYYHPDHGFVLAVGMEDEEITGEREELVCTGDSLITPIADILETCGIEEVDALLEELCKVSPDAFCAQD